MNPRHRILFSAAGRRVALMRLFEKEIQHLGLDAEVLATDIHPLSAAYQLAEHKGLVPPYSHPGCLQALLDYCRQQHVKLIVPTIDPDIRHLAPHRERFLAQGTDLHLSGPDTAILSGDKRAIHHWLVKHRFPTVRQTDLNTLLEHGGEDWPYPLVVKPPGGSSSIGVQRIENREQLMKLSPRADLIVQTAAPGREYTVDVFVDRPGICRCAVPRLRLETRGGEVSKAMTVRIQPVQELAARIANTLPLARGVMNLQMFHDEASDQLNVIELNARFGGGYPLTDAAGATMARWVLEETFGLPCTAHDQWRDGLVMLRYDEAVFVNRSDAGL